MRLDFKLKPKIFGLVDRINLYDEKYENWLRTLPCVVCGHPDSVVHHNWHRRKNSYTAMPLCVNHHTHGNDAYHKLEHREFERRHNVVIGWVIINLQSYYLANFFQKK